MDISLLRIKSVVLPKYNIVTIVASNSVTYTADLSSFSPVYCYPRDYDTWSQGFISEGFMIAWPGGFDVHVDQIIMRSINGPQAKIA
jgi:hypothetical protein